MLSWSINSMSTELKGFFTIFTKGKVTAWHACADTERRPNFHSSLFALSVLLSASCLGCFTPEKEPQYPFYMRLGGPQGPVWTGTTNLTPTRISSTYHPACSRSLYRLHYPCCPFFTKANHLYPILKHLNIQSGHITATCFNRKRSSSDEERTFF